MRIFIAIDLPVEIKSKIFHEMEQIEKKKMFGGKIVDKENLHLTMKFFGETDNEKAGEILKNLGEIKFKKFDCEIGETGFFDSEEHIKVAWINAISDKLGELSRKISEKFPQSEKERDFSPHITLARVNSINDRKGFIEEIRKIKIKNPKFGVGEFLLMKSELSREGPKYKVLKRFKLE